MVNRSWFTPQLDCGATLVWFRPEAALWNKSGVTRLISWHQFGMKTTKTLRTPRNTKN